VTIASRGRFGACSAPRRRSEHAAASDRPRGRHAGRDEHGPRRAWATLYNRYAQGCERKSLATGGPYSWHRNPLDLANTRVLLGGVAASGLWAWLPSAGLWFALVYTLTIRHEERRLLEKYGDAYAAHCAQVAGWLPRRRGEWPQVSWRRFLPALAVQSRSLLILAPFLLRGAL
jgi:hypothetical protein